MTIRGRVSRFATGADAGAAVCAGTDAIGGSCGVSSLPALDPPHAAMPTATASARQNWQLVAGRWLLSACGRRVMPGPSAEVRLRAPRPPDRACGDAPAIGRRRDRHARVRVPARASDAGRASHAVQASALGPASSRARLRPAETQRLCSRILEPPVKYSTGMAIDVTARRGRLQNSLVLGAGPLAAVVTANVHAAERAAGALYRGEPSAWSSDAHVQRTIANRLGWMSVPQLMRESTDRLRALTDQVQRDGTTDVVLLGMGGSSLAPEVLRAIVGVRAGSPNFHMLDSTDPDAVRAVATPPETTLYIQIGRA